MSLIHAEWLKLSRRKLYPVMLLVVAALMAITAFFTTAFADIAPPVAGEVFYLEKPEAFAFGAQQAASLTWLPIVLAVAVFGSEFKSAVWSTALTRDPSIPGHVGARVLMFTTASWVAFVVGTAVFSLIVALAASGSGSPPGSEWLGYLWKFLAVALAWTALGLGAVAVTRSTVLALVVTLGFSFIDTLVAVFVDNYDRLSLSAASTGLFDAGLSGGPFAALIPGADLSVANALAIFVAWTFVGFALTWWGLQRRDA